MTFQDSHEAVLIAAKRNKAALELQAAGVKLPGWDFKQGAFS